MAGIALFTCRHMVLSATLNVKKILYFLSDFPFLRERKGGLLGVFPLSQEKFSVLICEDFRGIIGCVTSSYLCCSFLIYSLLIWVLLVGDVLCI